MSNWKITSDLYDSLIERPKMSEKLLSKPPFKYLFDIIMETNKKTGFGNGLYEGEELKPDYYGEKKRKIDFLVKIISLVEAMSGQKVAANPQKIVAGMEPEQTNQFLQIMHKCATSGKSSDPHVRRVLGGEPAEEPEAKPEKKKVERPPSAAKNKKPDPKEAQPAPSKKAVEKEPEMPQPKEEEPAVVEKPKKKQEYSKKVQELMEEGEEEVKKESEAKKVEEPSKSENQISLGRVGKNKKKQEGGEKLISNSGELSEKELDLVKSMIQSICHNTAPLGKSIEFINDDIESMNREQQFWRKQYHASKAKYQNELKVTEEALLPIYDKLGEIEEQIKDQRGKIQTAKAQIIKNDSTIRDLLMSVIATK